MTTGEFAHLQPDVLRWARESIGLTLEDAAQRIGIGVGKLAGAEQGEDLLTLRQAEKAADAYDRPLAALFLPVPPSEEPQEAQFRRLPGAPSPPWPPAMVALTRRIRLRQEAAGDLYDLLEDVPRWPDALVHLKADHRPKPESARELLGITFGQQEKWRDPKGYVPLRNWVDAVESLGVLVMQDGTLPVESMRGFASVHPTVPAIVINTQDDARARVFTLLHELAHLYLSGVGSTRMTDAEEWCNGFASELLMPQRHFETMLARLDDLELLARFDELALRFGVTPRAAVVRAVKLALISQADADEALLRIDKRSPRSGGGGGNYYRNQLGRLGPAFIRLVLAGLDSQALTYPAASSLLGVKVNNFDKLRTYTEERAIHE